MAIEIAQRSYASTIPLRNAAALDIGRIITAAHQPMMPPVVVSDAL
jgi:hypothetical protein